MAKINSVAIFCSSSSKVPESFLEQTSQLVRILVNNNIHIYYGGGFVGLMGQVADTTLSLSGKITGIIPQFMVEQGWNNTEVEQMIVVDNMCERKKALIELSQACIVLPGGFGTLDEAFEAIALKQLGQYSSPIVFANFNKFFTPILEFNSTLVENGVIRAEHLRLFDIINSPDEIMSCLEDNSARQKDFLDIAQI